MNKKMRFSAASILLLFGLLQAQEGAPFFTNDFPPEEFVQRRTKVYDAIGQNGVALVQAATMPSGYVKFRQSNEFYYLSGIETPYSYLLLNGATRTTSAYLPSRNERRERVEGKLLSAQDGELLQKLSGVQSVFEVVELRHHLSQLVEENPELVVFTPFRPAEGYATSRDMAQRQLADIKADPWDNRPSRGEAFRKLLGEELPQVAIQDLSPTLDALRLIKSPRELDLIRKATRLSGLALMEGMRSTKPGVFEYELEAVAKFIFFRNGAQGHGYYSLIAGGKNAWYPHYHASKKQLQNGELLLVDWAPNVGYYVTDVTRQWPVNGKFSDWQRELYGFYLACYEAILYEIGPNETAYEIMTRAYQKMVEALAESKFSKPEYENAATQFVNGYGQRIQPGRARLGHWVGMAAHDVGAFDGPLRPGMVFTIEPALRVPEEQIYIRLEDMILITEDGTEIMSDFVPRDMDAIEHVMREPGLLQQYAKEVSLTISR